MIIAMVSGGDGQRGHEKKKEQLRQFDRRNGGEGLDEEGE